MPELPEVETIRSQLCAATGAKIVGYKTSKLAKNIIQEEAFSPVGCTIEKIARHGKVLYFQLNSQRFMISQLGMSGGWRLSPDPCTESHTHIEMKLQSPQGVRFLSYVDPRRFGAFRLVNQAQYEEHRASLGLDLASAEFTEGFVWDLLRRHPHKPIKGFLLDQKYFAGCGNYLANEICAESGIRPMRLCKSLTKNDTKKMVGAVSKILTSAISAGGLSFSGGYKDASGRPGQALKNLVVFHQEFCGRCKKKRIKKIVLASRGTFYCPRCQK